MGKTGVCPIRSDELVDFALNALREKGALDDLPEEAYSQDVNRLKKLLPDHYLPDIYLDLPLKGRYSGMAAVFDGRLVVDCMQTRVWFRSLSDQEIDDYLATGEPMDKAGAYAVQQKGSLFVSRIDGDFFNVVGLSACGTDRMLRDAFGFGLSDCE